jgi:hypothetical protein
MANGHVIRSKRFPYWRKPHHVRKATGWTQVSSLAYGIHFIVIAEQIDKKIVMLFPRYKETSESTCFWPLGFKIVAGF